MNIKNVINDMITPGNILNKTFATLTKGYDIHFHQDSNERKRMGIQNKIIIIIIFISFLTVEYIKCDSNSFKFTSKDIALSKVI